MKMSNMLVSTLREVPAEAEIDSHKLMLRAGMIRKMAAGVYNYMPIGLKVSIFIAKVIPTAPRAITTVIAIINFKLLFIKFLYFITSPIFNIII